MIIQHQRVFLTLRKLYFRKDRVGEPKCKILKKKITKNLAWCDDPAHKKYNEEIHTQIKNQKNYFIGKIMHMII